MKLNFKYILFVLFLFFIHSAFAQKDDSLEYKKYLYPNGKISSEGYLKEKKPEGYWKSYYETGILKSEGNRKNFLLDSLWKFYDKDGKVTLEINYREAKKNGLRTTYNYTDSTVTEENFVNDQKEGITRVLKNKIVLKIVPFVGGYENGIAKEYNKEGVVVVITEYRNGLIIMQENINRIDKEGLKQGKWKVFYPKGRVKWEGFFMNGKKNGFFKEYDTTGNLQSVLKYENDSLKKDAPETVKHDIKTDYYRNGNIKIVGSYLNNVPDGLRRDYSIDGKVTSSTMFKEGVIIAEGVVDNAGFRQGLFKEFYETGELLAEGYYKDNKRVGEWKYYHKNGKTEQVGKYGNAEKPQGLWKWYYPSGNLRREESFERGLEEGVMKEYSDTNTVIIEGNYVEGLKDGEWKYKAIDYYEVGPYKDDMKNGTWKGYYTDGTLRFEGSFLDEVPDRKHTYYYPNGKINITGNFAMGRKDGDWFHYNPDGSLFLIITYKDGLESQYNGVKLTPAFDRSDAEILY
ncbi:MAG: hypothetical protein V2A54_15460 [Bacteroidota bacterium]